MAEILSDCLEERDALLFVTSEDGSCKGWRVDLLVEKLSSKVEKTLLLCSCCDGLLRDACFYEEELRCGVCIPEGVSWQPVKMNRNIVNEKTIYCPLKWRGCGWSETVSAAVHHLEDCLYLPEHCPLGCVSLVGEKKGEVIKIERRHLPEHVKASCPMRIVVCEFCKGEVKACEMNPHLEDCNEFPLLCPKGCSSTKLKRRDIPVHLDNHCPLQKVQCAYWDHGCREEMERRLTDTHERELMHIHFRLSLTDMKRKQNELITRLQRELVIASEKITTLEKQHSVISRELSEVKEKSNEKIGNLERQIADKDKRIQSLSEIIFSYTQLPTGRLEWNVRGVKQKVRNKGHSYSDPFYVGLYKSQCWIHWDHGDTGKVRVSVCLMKGDFDEKLHWPIRFKYTFILINQINCDNNLVKSNDLAKEDLENYPDCFKRPTEYRNCNGVGCSSFISSTEILNMKYCKQDSVTLHVSIELLPHIV